MEPEYWKRAIIKLKKEDVILKSVTERNQKNILKSRKDPFGTLLKSIVGQQISVKAAESIYKKLLKLLQADVSPNMLLSIDKQALRETGLSRQKINYLFILILISQVSVTELIHLQIIVLKIYQLKMEYIILI